VAQDRVRAQALYEQAAAGGVVRAELSLAMLFEAGLDWPLDLSQAHQWYRRAAEHGSADAQVNLAWLYAEGIGVERDVIEACALLTAAADSGHNVGRSNLELLQGSLDSTALSEVKTRARRYLVGAPPELASAPQSN